MNERCIVRNIEFAGYIDKLKLSESLKTMAFNALRRVGIESIEELKQISIDELRSISCIGPTIIGALMEVGYISPDKELDFFKKKASEKQRLADIILAGETCMEMVKALPENKRPNDTEIADLIREIWSEYFRIKGFRDDIPDQ